MQQCNIVILERLQQSERFNNETHSPHPHYFTRVANKNGHLLRKKYLIKDVEIALALGRVDDTNLLQQIIPSRRTANATHIVEVDLNVFAKARRIVVTQGFGIAKSLRARESRNGRCEERSEAVCVRVCVWVGLKGWESKPVSVGECIRIG